jgi:hypothetical protein
MGVRHCSERQGSCHARCLQRGSLLPSIMADPSQTIPLPTGHVVSIHGVQPQSIAFSIVSAAVNARCCNCLGLKVMNDGK